MRNIKEMQIVLIEATNSCNKACSNCTRMCGHYTKDKIFFMDLDYFEKAARTYTEFSKLDNKIVGVMGGEPTLHPQFESICEIFKKYIPDKRKRAIFTNSTTPQFKNHITAIADTFGYFNFNNHEQSPVEHAPVLTALEDFTDMTEKEKADLIDDCWVNKYWSATITPKGAYFCEVAAAMATLFDGPDGWDIEKEPDWWKKEIPEYKEQIDWACHKCGCCAPQKPRRSTSEIDDISISNMKRLQQARSPKILNGKFNLVECSKKILDYSQIRSVDWYWRK